MPDTLFERAVEKLREARRRPTHPCKVCGGTSRPFDIVDFNKSCDQEIYPNGLDIVPILYHRCDQCDFISTSFFDDFTSEDWRRHVYNDDYQKIDPEYLEVRPRQTARQMGRLLAGAKTRIIGLDYGGGNGLTARLMREGGWAYDCYDPFGHTDLAPEHTGQYNFCSAVEVIEHAVDPAGFMRDIVSRCSPGRLMIMIGTSIHDGRVSNGSRLSWWYAGPRNGHISLYSRRALQTLAAQFGLTYASVSHGTHLLMRDIADAEAYALLLRRKPLRRWRMAMSRWAGQRTG